MVQIKLIHHSFRHHHVLKHIEPFGDVDALRVKKKSAKGHPKEPVTRTAEVFGRTL